jgi:hypothetical protein
MDYLPIQDFADKWNISKRRIQVLCREGRVNGARMIGNMWVIPENATRPSDARIKSPTVKNTNMEESVVRKELKKLLKSLYKIAENSTNEESGKKNYVLVSIAAGLCGYYIGVDSLSGDIKKKISKDLTGQEEAFVDEDILREVSDFISRYKEDRELDNLLSWAYQYSNKIIKENIYSQTQFFTEKYMIDYLVGNISEIEYADKIVDPCTGGGNFLVECLEVLCGGHETDMAEISVVKNSDKLYGYDIDCNITRVALVNVRLRALAILSRKSGNVSFEIWENIKPHIYKSVSKDNVCGSLAVDDKEVVDAVTGAKTTISKALGEADVILTNPPFATIKGMQQEQKDFLKENYPEANCDMCVSYFDAIYNMLKEDGVCGIVSQNAWMHLKTFREIRARITSSYKIISIANLGSGAFLDLSGEKSSVALVILKKSGNKNNKISVADLSVLSLEEKRKALLKKEKFIEILQQDIDGINGYDFSEKGTLKNISESEMTYKDIAVPMQGTSTGNAKELVGYFWEHFGDDAWISVSNGGGYCRWQGLNDSVVKWGKDGEYIKTQKGSALRNVKYFPETQMVFSDTGTAGLNVRVLRDNQIFIASGPGIRVTEGNEYAHLALLNSRLAAYCVRMMSPKLTIAAGYIGQIPITKNIGSSVVLEKNARLCIELKKKLLSTRPNNLEYNPEFLDAISGELDVAAWEMFNEDLTDELLKLQIESKIDSYIFEEYGLSDDDREQLEKAVGECAYCISGPETVDLIKLDKYMEKLLDASCCLKRTRVAGNSLGCDGIVEYLSKDLRINPEVIVKKIQENPYAMKAVLGKYKKMILHDVVLDYLGYNTHSGISVDRCMLDEVSISLNRKFKDEIDGKAWIKNDFNRVHSEIFKGKPYLLYENGVICKYDRTIAC